MEFVRLAQVSDFGSARIKSFRIFGKLIGIVRDPDGTFWATEIACKHQHADLSSAPCRGDEIRCPRHGWVYNIRTGECLNQNSAPLRRHELKREGDDLLVCLQPIEPVATDDDWDPMPEIRRKSKPDSD